jgi:predicted secreted protein
MNLQHCLASLRLLAAIALTPVAVIATAQVPAPSAPSPPTVTVTATATTTVANDRLQAWLRAEAENVSPAAAAS